MIPTRNRWELLSTCALPAARSQEGVELEIVVVDDGSTDETAVRLSRLEDPRLRLERTNGVGNVSAARNRGTGATRGAWIAFLDDDDLWAPRKLETQLAAAHEVNASIVYAGAVVLDARKQLVAVLDPPEPETLASSLRARYAIPAGCSNVMVRADLFRACGGFDERLRFFADWDLWLRLAQAGRAAACPEPLVGYVRHAESGLFGTVRELDAEVSYLFAKNGSGGLTADPGRLLAWTAREHRRVGCRTRAAGLYLRAARRSRPIAHSARAVSSLLGIGGFAEHITSSTSRADEPSWLAAYR